MATISKKSVKRETAKRRAIASKVDAASPDVKELEKVAKEKLMQLATPPAATIPAAASNVAPPDNAPTITFDEWLGRDDDEERTTAAAEVAKSHRIMGALLLMWSVPDHIVLWSQHWTAYRGTDKKKKADALEWFEDDFKLAKRNTLTGDVLRRRDEKRNRLLRSVEFCIELRKRGLLGSFTFTDTGACFLSSKSTLGQHVWKMKKWNEDADLLKGGADVQIVDRKTVKPVFLSWAELENMVIPKKVSTMTSESTTTADTPFGDGSTRTVPMRTDKPLDMMQEAGKALASATEHSLHDRQRAIIEIESIVHTMFKAPAYLEVRKLFETAFKEARIVVKLPPRAAMGTGKATSLPIKGIDPNVVIPFKAPGAVSPDSVKDLPLVTLPPAKTVTAEELKAHRKAHKKTANKRR